MAKTIDADFMRYRAGIPKAFAKGFEMFHRILTVLFFYSKPE